MRLLTAALLTGLAACAVGPAADDEPVVPRPNVLLLIADDQGWADLSCAGHAADVRTPALDRLARRGTRFTRAYATSPICNTSRMGLMLGVYPQRLSSFWYGGEGLSDPAFPTLAEVLRERGYRTAYVGKFHYGRHGVHVPGDRNFPLEHGFDSFFGFSAGRKHYLVHESAREEAFQDSKRAHDRPTGQSLRMDPLWENEERVDTVGFTTELFGERAERVLRDHAARTDGTPLFLTLAFNAVHNFTHQLPADYLAAHGLGWVRDWDPAEEPFYDWYVRGRKPNNPEGRATYLGQLHYVDREVGRMLDTLDELGMTGNTLVVYIGDNGGSTPIYADNGPLRGSKYTLYEGGIRVPLLVSWPDRFGTGRVSDEIVSALDVFPTVARACGARVPEHLDGRDVSACLEGSGADERGGERRALFFATHAETAVVQGNWKLRTARSDQHAQYEMVELELGEFLHDLGADPGERRDLFDERPERAEAMLEMHAAWRARVSSSEPTK